MRHGIPRLPSWNVLDLVMVGGRSPTPRAWALRTTCQQRRQSERPVVKQASRVRRARAARVRPATLPAGSGFAGVDGATRPPCTAEGGCYPARCHVRLGYQTKLADAGPAREDGAQPTVAETDRRRPAASRSIAPRPEEEDQQAPPADRRHRGGRISRVPRL